MGVWFGGDNAEGRDKSNELLLSYTVEGGNIILAILAEIGVGGMVIFTLLILSCVYQNKINNSKSIATYKQFLLVASLLISFGEMTFFLGNSLGVMQWLFLGIYSNGIEISEKIKGGII